MKLWILCFLAAIAVSPACNERVDKEGVCENFELGEEFEARIHDTWCLENGNLAITFGSILDDSRCNIVDVECVWAGKFTMFVDIDLAGDITRDTFDAVHNWQDTIQAGAYNIALVKVLPEMRTMNNPVDTSEYTLRIIVE